MRRLCERPGCAAPAEVSYGIDNSSLTVWLDNSHVPEREHAGRLCRRHANALVVPRGWTVDDRRQPVPQLFRDLHSTSSDQPDKARQSSPRPTKKNSPSSTAKQNLKAVSAESEHEQEPTLFESPVDPDETQAISWSPAIVKSNTAENNDASVDTHDDGELEHDSPVFGRLMGRAFRNKGTQ